MLVLACGCGRIGFDPMGSRDGQLGGDDATLMTPSCAGSLPVCGPLGTSSCCGSSVVPAGTYDREFDVGTDHMFTNNAFPATISDFRLDTYDVSVGRFRQFVNAGMGTQQNPPVGGTGAHTAIANSGWDATWNTNLPADTATLEAAVTCGVDYTWSATPSANDGFPMNCMSWWEAMAFCIWDDGYLPTEAEWNYAAAAGSEQRAFPWSMPASALTLDCSYANYYDGVTACVSSPTGAVNRTGSESPKGDGKWGHVDLSGNVYQWALDFFSSPEPLPCIDCAQLAPAATRVARGGFFHTDTLRTGQRYGADPANPSNAIGVRCARAP